MIALLLRVINAIQRRLVRISLGRPAIEPDVTCPFCPKNGKVRIMAENAEAYLIAVLEKGEVLAGCYFIIPKRHVRFIPDLPDNWHVYFTDLLLQIPGMHRDVHYNISLNCGKRAGQMVQHLHWWIVQREGEEGMPSYELGLAKLIRSINALHGA
jgi:diadenosine tetraphosphate (Ap4A) HIT family hydrolase